MIKSRKNMTKEQRATVLQLYAEGVKMECIVETVGKTKAAIQRFLKKQGVPRRPAGYWRPSSPKQEMHTG